MTRTAERVVEVDGIPISALAHEAREPRAVVVALHGGSTTSAYFDAPNRPRLSLLRTASALGFTAIALDRPGYGASAGYVEPAISPARLVDLAYAAVDRLLAPGSSGLGVFVMGHSAGSQLAARMAADERGIGLLGIELGATGRHFHDMALEIRSRRLRDGTRSGSSAAVAKATPRPRLHDILFGPAGLYPAGIDKAAGIYAPLPAYEVEMGHRWTGDLPQLAARTRVPVQLSLGDHENWWRSGPSALADLAALFTASPRVAVNTQADTGHNMSLGRSALAYHLRVLSFVEECAVARENAGLAAEG